MSVDTVVPDPSNAQFFKRYSYVRKSPVRYVDPTGHNEEEKGEGQGDKGGEAKEAETSGGCSFNCAGEDPPEEEVKPNKDDSGTSPALKHKQVNLRGEPDVRTGQLLMLDKQQHLRQQ